MVKFRLPWASPQDTTIISAIDGITTNPPHYDHSPPGEKDSKSPLQQSTSITAVAADLPAFQASHQWDPNLPQSTLDALNSATITNDVEKIHQVAAVFAEDSPYEEVRAAVRTTDGGEVANTVRAWVLGMIFVTLGSGLNMFLSMRYVTSAIDKGNQGT